jgi:Ca2+-binding EF-hand superfamily protein
MDVEEMELKAAELFASVDVSGDGAIDIEEFLAHEPRHRSGSRFHGQKGAGHPSADMDNPADPAADPKPGRHSRQFSTENEDRIFVLLDADGDGVLSDEEFSATALRAARMTAMKEQMFEHLDRNGDGILTDDEFPPRRMASFDANGDGSITRDELPRGHRPADAG